MNKSTNKFSIRGPKIHPFIYQEGSIVDTIPAGVYQIKEDLFGYFLLKTAEAVTLPATIYGSTHTRADRILKTFNAQSAAMGVGLFGSKGAGKTLLANVLAQKSIEMGRAVIDVSDSFTTKPEYLNFIDSLGSVTIIFDEFLKTLSRATADDVKSESGTTKARLEQDKMLTFFQGTNNSKRLIILIDNSMTMLSDFLVDRPGRMRYWYVYQGIEADVVGELAKAANLSDAQTEKLQVYAKRYKVTFDVINTIIQEWLMYPEDTLEQLTDVLNVPSIYPEYTTKASIVSHELPAGLMLENELVEIKSNGSFEVSISRTNPFYGAPELSKEDFETSQWEHDFSFEYFKHNRTEPRLKSTLYLDNDCLCGISGNKQAYKSGSIKINLELFDTYVSKSTQLNAFY